MSLATSSAEEKLRSSRKALFGADLGGRISRGVSLGRMSKRSQVVRGTHQQSDSNIVNLPSANSDKEDVVVTNTNVDANARRKITQLANGSGKSRLSSCTGGGLGKVTQSGPELSASCVSSKPLSCLQESQKRHVDSCARESTRAERDGGSSGRLFNRRPSLSTTTTTSSRAPSTRSSSGQTIATTAPTSEKEVTRTTSRRLAATPTIATRQKASLGSSRKSSRVTSTTPPTLLSSLAQRSKRPVPGSSSVSTPSLPASSEDKPLRPTKSFSTRRSMPSTKQSFPSALRPPSASDASTLPTPPSSSTRLLTPRTRSIPKDPPLSPSIRQSTEATSLSPRPTPVSRKRETKQTQQEPPPPSTMSKPTKSSTAMATPNSKLKSSWARTKPRPTISSSSSSASASSVEPDEAQEPVKTTKAKSKQSPSISTHRKTSTRTMEAAPSSSLSSSLTTAKNFSATKEKKNSTPRTFPRRTSLPKQSSLSLSPSRPTASTKNNARPQHPSPRSVVRKVTDSAAPPSSPTSKRPAELSSSHKSTDTTGVPTKIASTSSLSLPSKEPHKPNEVCLTPTSIEGVKAPPQRPPTSKTVVESSELTKEECLIVSTTPKANNEATTSEALTNHTATPERKSVKANTSVIPPQQQRLVSETTPNAKEVRPAQNVIPPLPLTIKTTMPLPDEIPATMPGSKVSQQTEATVDGPIPLPTKCIREVHAVTCQASDGDCVREDGEDNSKGNSIHNDDDDSNSMSSRETAQTATSLWSLMPCESVMSTSSSSFRAGDTDKRNDTAASTSQTQTLDQQNERPTTPDVSLLLTKADESTREMTGKRDGGDPVDTECVASSIRSSMSLSLGLPSLSSSSDDGDGDGDGDGGGLLSSPTSAQRMTTTCGPSASLGKSTRSEEEDCATSSISSDNSSCLFGRKPRRQVGNNNRSSSTTVSPQRQMEKTPPTKRTTNKQESSTWETEVTTVESPSSWSSSSSSTWSPVPRNDGYNNSNGPKQSPLLKYQQPHVISTLPWTTANPSSPPPTPLLPLSSARWSSAAESHSSNSPPPSIVWVSAGCNSGTVASCTESKGQGTTSILSPWDKTGESSSSLMSVETEKEDGVKRKRKRCERIEI